MRIPHKTHICGEKALKTPLIVLSCYGAIARDQKFIAKIE